MGFQKGRAKTGGRQKGGTVRKSKKFVEQLSIAGFNYVKELASTLKEMKDACHGTGLDKDPVVALKKAAELKFFYGELKSLLPYMAPKLREKEVETTDEPEDQPTPTAVSDEDLLKAMGNGTETETLPRASNPPSVATGDSKLQVPASAEKDLLSLAGEQEQDS